MSSESDALKERSLPLPSSDMADETRPAWGFARHKHAEQWEYAGTTEQEAREHAEDEGGGFIAEAHYPSPAKFAAEVICLDDIIERMDEASVDDEFYSEDPIFELLATTTKEQAEEDLRAVVGAWATRHLRPTQFTVRGDYVKVEAPDAD